MLRPTAPEKVVNYSDPCFTHIVARKIHYVAIDSL